MHAGIQAEKTVTVKDELSDTLVNTFALIQYDPRLGLDWTRKLDSQRGAVLASEMKNNAYKLTKWTTSSVLAGVDLIKLGFVTREATDRKKHSLLGCITLKPLEFLENMRVDLGNGWGIFKAFVQVFQGLDDGKYVLVKDPLKPSLGLYLVSADQ